MRIKRTKIIVPILALFLMASGTAFAQGLVAKGPNTTVGIFPAWYMDSTGTALEACIDGSAFCLGSTAADLTDPLGVGEAFYWMASADLGPAPSLFEVALEMAFLTVPGDAANAQVFNRLRARMFGLPVGGDHTITHPWGQVVVPTEPGGVAGTFDINFTDDFGGIFVGEQSFQAVLGAPYVGPFLRSVSVPPPPGYIGSAAPSTVTGGTVGNSVTIEGPAVNDTTDLFTVIGKLATNGGMDRVRATLTRGLDGKKTIKVRANSIGGQTISATFGPARPIPKPKFRQFLAPHPTKVGVYTATATFGPNALIEPIKVKNRSSVPPTVVDIPNVADKITITSAIFTAGNLTVNATTTDVQAALTVHDAFSGIALGPVNAPIPLVSPPATVQVRSTSNGIRNANVVVQ